MKTLAALSFGVLCALIAGCSSAAHPPSPKGAEQSNQKYNTSPSWSSAGVPAWLPPYTKDQLDLLAPENTPIQWPAKRVFPDLSRFGYARNHRIDDTAECLKFTRLIATIVTQSDHYYIIGLASNELSNLVAQYGPRHPDEPDGSATMTRDALGEGTLVPATLSPEAKQALDEGASFAGKKAWPEAISAYRQAAKLNPDVPLVHLALARALRSSGDEAGAADAFQAALALDTALPAAYLGLAETLEKKGDPQAAKRALAEALAYWPSSAKALAMAARLSGKAPAEEKRIAPFRAFIDVDTKGAVRVASGEDITAQMYASCRAVMRYEPKLRSVIFDEPEETPYYLSAVEEVVCLEAALGAYLLELSRDRKRVPDASMEALLTIGRDEGLLGYVMFEVLGPHRPDRVHRAPPDVHRAVVRYVTNHVLGEGRAIDKNEKIDLPEGVFSAQR